MRVDDVDLSDGETLQLSGDAASWIVWRLRLVATADGRTLSARAESISSTRGRARFHVVLDITPLLDRSHGQIRTVFTVGPGRCRVQWVRGAFADPNAAAVRMVAPDLARGLHCTIGRSTDGSGVTITRKRLRPRMALASLSLGDSCCVGLTNDDSIRSVSWRSANDSLRAERTPSGWVWADVTSLARAGTRWSLVAEDIEGRTVRVGLGLGDLLDPGVAREFPIQRVSRDGERFRLAVAVDRRRRVVMGSRRIGGMDRDAT